MPFTSGDNFNFLQESDTAIVGAGGGNDTYVLDSNLLAAGQRITVSDTLGSNILQLVGGLTIASSQIASDALKLVLSNGAEITILGASSFTYVTGGAIPSGAGGLSQNYADFVTGSLGGTVPVAGTSAGAPNLTVNPAGGTGTTPPPTGLPYVLTASVSDVTEGLGNLAFRLELDRPATSDVTISVFTGAAGDTTTAGQDYTPVARQVTFQAGQQVQFVEVVVLNDSLVEGPETVSLVINAPSNVTVGGDLQAVITSDDLGNRAPVAYAADFVGNEGDDIPGQLAGTDLDGDLLVYSVTTAAANGTVSLTASTGAFVYTPNVGFSGGDSFEYTVSDGNGGTSSALITITVNDVANELTPGNDTVVISGSVGQTVIGSDLTYNPGDNIQGSSGVDTLHLGLAPGDPVVLGSATVNGIEIFRVNANPGTPADAVTLLMSNVDDALQRVELTRSLGESFTVSDLQNLPVIAIDDVGAFVTVDVDNQVVAGPADRLGIEVLEFGSNSSSAFGRSELDLDDGLETVELTDRAPTDIFASDISRINGGYSTFLINGGATGVPLTVQEGNAAIGEEDGGFISVAGPGITVDSTAFLGNLIADIDGARDGVVRTGVGDDALTAHQDIAGEVNSGAGDDLVRLMNTAVAFSEGDLLLGGRIESGAGDDTVDLDGDVAGVVDAGTENDVVDVDGAVSGTVLGGDGNDEIGVAGGVSGTVRGDDGGDLVSVEGGITGTVEGNAGNDTLIQETGGDAGRVTGSMLGGADDDVIRNEGTLGDDTLLFNAGVVDGGDGNDTIEQNGAMQEGSSILGGAGNDTITASGTIEGDTGVGDGQSAASISGGAGNDTITIGGQLDGDVDAGTEDDLVTFTADQDEGSVQLGDGDDSVVFRNDADFLGDDGADGNDGSIDGGAGNNTMTLLISDYGVLNREMEVGSDGSPAPAGVPDGTDITSIQTLNVQAIDLDTILDVESNQTFDVNLQAFDASLDTVNVLERDDSMIVNFGGYDGETVNVDSDGDAGTDVFLNVSTGVYGADEAVNAGALHPLHNANETLPVNLNGTSAFEVEINDAAGINVTNLGNNGSGARTVMLDGADQDNNGGTAGEGNSLSISGTNASRLRVTGIYQESINASGHAGPVTLVVANDDTVGADGDPDNDNEALTVATAGGDDVVNLVADILDLADSVNLGAGTDRLIINESTRFLSLVDEDQVFKSVDGAEILELRGSDATNGATPLQISIEDDSRDAGIRTIDVTHDGAVAGDVDLDVDADYMDTSLPDLLLTVNVMSGVVDIDNGADVDTDVNLYANSGNSDGGAAVAGAGVNFTETGSGDVDVAVHVNTGATLISASTLAGPNTADPAVVGNVRMDVGSGEIDSLTLVDSAAIDNGDITLTWSDSWASGGALTIDASGIVNNDFDIPLGSPNTLTGGLYLIAAAEDDVRLTILGTQNDDVIWGGQESDAISGNDGDDFIFADPEIGAVVAPGVQMAKTLTFSNDDVEAGDQYEIEVGGQTYTWTAAADSDTVADALAALAVAINADQSTVDGDADVDVLAEVSGLTMTFTGIDVDDIFGYALGEDIAVSGVARDRPTAVVTLDPAEAAVTTDGSEGLDVGDVVTVTINGTPHDAAVGALSTSGTLQSELIDDINAGGDMSAAAGSIVLRGNTAETAYTLDAEWSVDQVTVLATAKTVSVTYSGAPTSVAVTFSGGLTLSADTVANLAAAINGNVTLAPQWTAADAGGGVLSLTADVAGAPAPANDFVSATVGGVGSASFASTAGTDAVLRTDNSDPTIAARSISFTMTDFFYDEGDAVVLNINGTDYTAALPSTTAGDDDDYTPADTATAVAAALNGLIPAGYLATPSGAVVTVTAPDTVAYPTWAVSVTDAVPVDAVEEVVTLDYTGFVAGADLEVTATIGTAYTAATVGDLVIAINAETGTHGYSAAAVGAVITLTSVNTGDAVTGEEPAVDKAAITGTYTSDGGAVTPVAGTNALAQPREEVVDFTGMTSADGADITVNGTTYSSIDVGTSTQTLQSLVDQVNADTLTHGFTAAVTDADTITLTGPADGSNPGTGATAANVLPDGGDITAAAPAGGTEAIPGFWAVSAVDFDENVDSVSVTFDVSGDGAAGLGDLTFSGFTYQALADQINANVGGLGANLVGVSGAEVVAGVLRIYARTDGSAPVAGDDIPISAGFAGTGGPATVGVYAAGTAAVPFTQVLTVAQLDAAGETATVRLSDGTVISVPFGVSEVASLTALGAAIEAAIEADGKVGGGAIDVTIAVDAVLNTITVTGPANGDVPATTISTTASHHDITGTAVAGVITPTAGVPADPYDVTIDFVNLDAAGEEAYVRLAGGATYQETSVGDLIAAINADSLVHGWTASSGGGQVLILTGPTDGTAPSIGFASAGLWETDAAVAALVSESYHNLDNTDPTLQVTSGLANTGPAAGVVTAAVAAATALANGDDTVNGGSGNDTIFGYGGDDELNGDAGSDTLFGGDGVDSLSGGDGDDFMEGGNDDDLLEGGTGDDWANGQDGTDTVNGGAGNDSLHGGAGNDTLNGGEGDDRLAGNTGRDILTGGSGSDTFAFLVGDSQGQVGVADQVVDFVNGEDLIDLTGLAGASGVFGTWDRDTDFAGTVTDTTNLIAALNAGGPAIGRTVYDSTAKLLYVDVDGNGVITVAADMTIELTGVASLSVSDFLG